MAAEATPFLGKAVPLNSWGSVVLPDDPNTPAPFEYSVLPELGEFVLQHTSQLEQKGINVTELNSIFTSIKLAAKVVNRIITRQGAYGLDGEFGCTYNSELRCICTHLFLTFPFFCLHDLSTHPMCDASIYVPIGLFSELCLKIPAEDIADLRAVAHRTFVDAITNRQGAAGLASSVDGNFIACEGCQNKVRAYALVFRTQTHYVGYGYVCLELYTAV